MARGEGTVVVRILGEIRDLAGKMRSATNEVGQFATSSKNLITKSFSDITSIVTSRMGRVGAEAQKTLDGIAESAAASGSGVALGVGAGAAAAAAALVALGAQGVKSFVDLANKIRELQFVTGATAEEASGLVAVMDDLKIPADQGAAAFFRLSKNIEGNVDALKSHGIEVVRNRNGSVDLQATLLNVADAYNRVGRGAEGNKLAFDAFGRSGAALIPLLEQGRDRLANFFAEADKHGEILNQGEVDQARKYELALDDLGDAVGGLERALGEGLVPILTDVAKTATTVIDDVDHLTRSVGGLTGIVERTWNAVTLKRVRDWAFGVKDAGTSLNDAESAASGLSGTLGAAGSGFDEITDSASTASDSLKAFDSAVAGINDSILGLPTAMADVDQAFADLEQNASTSTSKAADAQARLADAIEASNRRIRDAEQDLADAKEDLNKQSSGDRTDARRRVRDAEERLADTRKDSAKSIADAKKNIDDLTPSVAQTRHEAEGVLTAIEKTVDEMIKQHKPAADILDYITKQRDRFGEVGTKIGLDSGLLQGYLDVLTLVYQTTKDIANLPSLFGSRDSSGKPVKGGLFGDAFAAANQAGSKALSGGVIVVQNFNGPTDPAEQQRQAALSWGRALRSRG